MKTKSHFEFVPRDTEKSEFLDSVDFRDVAFSVDSVTVYMDESDQTHG